jgi:hypothetical protein
MLSCRVRRKRIRCWKLTRRDIERLSRLKVTWHRRIFARDRRPLAGVICFRVSASIPEFREERRTGKAK